MKEIELTTNDGKLIKINIDSIAYRMDSEITGQGKTAISIKNGDLLFVKESMDEIDRALCHKGKVDTIYVTDIQSSINELNLSVRSLNVIRGAIDYYYENKDDMKKYRIEWPQGKDIDTVGDLVEFGRNNLSRVPNCGIKTIKEISNALNIYFNIKW